MTDEELERRLRAWYRDQIPPDEAAPHDLRSRLALNSSGVAAAAPRVPIAAWGQLVRRRRPYRRARR